MAEEKKGFFRGWIDKISGAGELPAANDTRPVETPLDTKPEEEAAPSFFERLKKGLSKTHDSLIGRIDRLVLGKKEIDADTLEELEEILITADIGVTTSVELIRTLEQRLKRKELQDGAALRTALKEEILDRLVRYVAPLDMTAATP